MANSNNPFGFQYLTMNKGFPPLTRVFDKLSTLATAIFQQDLCHRVAGVIAHPRGVVEPFGTGTPGTSIILGVAMHYSAASTAAPVHVMVDPAAEYVAQATGTLGLLEADMGLNANMLANAGSTLTGFSKHVVNETGIATTSSLDMHLLRIFPDVLNAAGPYARVIVRLNKNREGIGTAGV